MYPNSGFRAHIISIKGTIPGFLDTIPCFSVLSRAGGPVYLCTMDVYEAISEMRRLSSEGKPFSFSFMSCNLTEGKSEGVVYVRHGKLRKREKTDHHRYSEMVEAYVNLDTMENRRFYQPLLMTFNGEKVELR